VSSVTNATIADIIAHTDFTTVGALDSTAADTMWLMVAGFLVFFMQLGFALLEAGTIRSKNTKNILLKNMLDACIGCLIWWSFGHAIAYDSGDGFIGMTEVSGTSKWFFMQDAVATKPMTAASAAADGYNMAAWFFQFTFAAAAATIVSGAMAERTALTGYIVYGPGLSCRNARTPIASDELFSLHVSL
jgi:Amt family ammonium transporter